MNIGYKKCWIITINLLAPSALAGGIIVNAQSANGLGRAFAGDGVIGDTPSIIATNPAGMALFKYSTVSIGASSNMSRTNLTNTTYGVSPIDMSADAENLTQKAAILPNLYWLAPINGKIRFGISLENNFNYDTEFEDDYVAAEFGGKTAISVYKFSNAVSYKLSKKWILGTAISMSYASLKMQRESSNIYDNAIFIGSINGNSEYDTYGAIADINGTGFGLGVNLGAMYRMNKRHRYAISYQINPDINVEGQVIRGHVKVGNGVALKLPNIINFSGFDELTPDWMIHYSLEMIQWSAFNNIETLGGLELFPYNWQDGYRIAIGGTWQFSKHWSIRGGYSYEITSNNEVKSASVPYFDSQLFACGIRYAINKRNILDVGAAFSTSGSSAVNESTYNSQTKAPITTINGMLEQRTTMISVQYTHRL